MEPRKILRGPRCVGRAGGLATHTLGFASFGDRCAAIAAFAVLHDLATPSQCQTPTWPRAKRHHPDARRRVSPARPPARPLWGGLRKMLQTHPAGGKNLKNPIRPSARQAETTRARCGVGLGCAGRVDAPEGIGRPAPKATTTMTTGGGRLGKSGAKAPDRNRSPARPGRRRAGRLKNHPGSVKEPPRKPLSNLPRNPNLTQENNEGISLTPPRKSKSVP